MVTMMRARTLRRAFLTLHLNVREAAQVLCMHERTLHRYLSGSHPIPRTVELAVRYLLLRDEIARMAG